MPGPLGKGPRRGRSAAPNTPARKTARRLAARLAAFPGESVMAPSGGGSMRFHKPGSQNRKK